MRRLRDEIVRLIEQEGPISVERYMALCLGHPTLGYYTTRDPFGAAGDFVTAPEISQMFGELLGLWAAEVWGNMGAPAAMRLVELGPGRATLMHDALRAISKARPAMLKTLSVHMVETSPVLRALQQNRLNGVSADVQWHERVEDALAGPAIVIANELLDALPVKQFVATAGGWRERLVGLDQAGALAFGLAPEPTLSVKADHPNGTILEIPLASDGLIALIAAHVAAHGGAALFIDYGSAQQGTGDTLQAVSRHAFADPLAAPGEADLTTQVNFERSGAVARTAQARVHGPVSQGELLIALGLPQRAQTLKRGANSEQIRQIDAATERLSDMDERGMGRLFKAIAISHPALSSLPGFGKAAHQAD